MKMTITFDPRNVPVDHLHTAIALLGATTSTEEATAPEEPALPEPLSFTVEPGATYRTRGGRTLTTLPHRCSLSGEVIAETGFGRMYFPADGHPRGVRFPSEWDLVERLNEPTSPDEVGAEESTPEQPARLQLQVGRTYRTASGLRAEVKHRNSEDSFSADLYGASSRPEPLDLFYHADGRCYGPVPEWDLVLEEPAPEEPTPIEPAPAPEPPPTPEPAPAPHPHVGSYAGYRPLAEGEVIKHGDVYVFDHDGGDGGLRPSACAGEFYRRDYDNYSGSRHAPHFRRIDQSPAGFPEGLLENLPPLPEPPAGMRWAYAGHGTIHNERRDNIYVVWNPHGHCDDRWRESELLSYYDTLHYAVAETAPDTAP